MQKRKKSQLILFSSQPGHSTPMHVRRALYWGKMHIDIIPQ